MFGQPAASQTVCSPSRLTRLLSSLYSGPITARVLIHSGLRSIGVWLLRTSRRSSLRPSGATLSRDSDKDVLQTKCVEREVTGSAAEHVGEVAFDEWKHLVDADVPAGLSAQRRDAGVDQA